MSLTLTHHAQDGAVPARVCGACGEFLPHYCAAVTTVTVTRTRGHRRIRSVVITDRAPPAAPKAGAAA